MKTTIGLALASGLFVIVAGCATGGGGGTQTVATAGGTTVASTGGEIRNFNLEVKCPGIHYLKTHGKSDWDIMEQMQMEQSDIDTCEAWAAAQPKGYVPPPPPGVAVASRPQLPPRIRLARIDGPIADHRNGSRRGPCLKMNEAAWRA